MMQHVNVHFSEFSLAKIRRSAQFVLEVTAVAGRAATPSTGKAAGVGQGPATHGLGGAGAEQNRIEAARPRGIFTEDLHRGQRWLDSHGPENRQGMAGSNGGPMEIQRRS